jgi:threonine/homoserine efflux transporter RhtA
MNQPEKIFRDRNYSLQALVSLITANYIVFAIGVQASVNCQRVHWFLWVVIAGLALYNYYTIKRNTDEFAEKRTQIMYGISILGMGLLYYLLGVVALHCNMVKPLVN